MHKVLTTCFVATLLVFLSASKTFAAIVFEISNLQQSGDEITVSISITGLTSSSCSSGSCYVQGAIDSTSGITENFGFTKNNSGNWIEYISNPETSYIQNNFFSFQPTNGAWSGNVTLKPNYSDTDYKGAGEYSIKLMRYSGSSSSSAGSSNTLVLNLSYTAPSPSPSPSLSPSPSASPSPSSSPSSSSSASSKASPSPSASVSPKPSPSPTKKPSPKPTPSPSQEPEIILAASTSEPTPKLSTVDIEQKSTGILGGNIIGIVFSVLGATFLGVAGYSYFKSRASGQDTSWGDRIDF